MIFRNTLLFVLLLSTATACTNKLSKNQQSTSALSGFTAQDRAIFGPPLSYAVSINNISLAKELILNDADINALNPVGKTPLIQAINDGHVEMLRLLLKYGAQPNNMEIGKDSCNHLLDLASAGNTRFYILPLDNALKKGNQDIIKVLKKYGAKSASACFEKVNEEQRILERESNKYYYQ